MRIYYNSGGNEFEISPEVEQVFARYRQHLPWQAERGGLLFADFAAPLGQAVRIIRATPPNYRDKSTRTSLLLDPRRCCREVRSANHEGFWFIGYWHTHPEPHPIISDLDIAAFYSNLETRNSGIDALLAIIVSSTGAVENHSYYLFRRNADEVPAKLTLRRACRSAPGTNIPPSAYTRLDGC